METRWTHPQSLSILRYSMHRRLAVFVALAFGASACSDSSGPGNPTSGSVSFSYTGAQSGSFNVTGAVTSLSAPSNTQPWAVGIRDQASSTIGVVANRPQSAGRYDVVVIAANRLTVGSSSIDTNCDPNFDTGCDGVAVVFDASDTQSSPTMLVCVLTGGTVTIASLTSSRVTGSFSGSGSCADQNSVETGFTVSEGTFDVALTNSTSGLYTATR